jgi:acetyl-CoA C-acetyltransferase
MDQGIWILGGYQSDFPRNLAKEGLDFADLTSEIVDAKLTAAKVNDFGGSTATTVSFVVSAAQG